MANRTARFGFKPASHFSSGGVKAMTREYTIDSGYATDIMKGDLVVMTTTEGQIEKGAANSSSFRGVFASVSYYDVDGEYHDDGRWPANQVATNIKALVYDDPRTIFECTGRTNGRSSVDADLIGLTAAPIVPAVQDVDKGFELSLMGVDLNSAAGRNKALDILGRIDKPDNEWDDYVRLFVRIKNHDLA